jgi:hypothetical protein
MGDLSWVGYANFWDPFGSVGHYTCRGRDFHKMKKAEPCKSRVGPHEFFGIRFRVGPSADGSGVDGSVKWMLPGVGRCLSRLELIRADLSEVQEITHV